MFFCCCFTALLKDQSIPQHSSQVFWSCWHVLLAECDQISTPMDDFPHVEKISRNYVVFDQRWGGRQWREREGDQRWGGRQFCMLCREVWQKFPSTKTVWIHKRVWYQWYVHRFLADLLVTLSFRPTSGINADHLCAKWPVTHRDGAPFEQAAWRCCKATWTMCSSEGGCFPGVSGYLFGPSCRNSREDRWQQSLASSRNLSDGMSSQMECAVRELQQMRSLSSSYGCPIVGTLYVGLEHTVVPGTDMGNVTAENMSRSVGAIMITNNLIMGWERWQVLELSSTLGQPRLGRRWRLNLSCLQCAFSINGRFQNWWPVPWHFSCFRKFQVGGVIDLC